MRAPTIGPSMRPMPPMTTMKIANAVQLTLKAASGLMRRLLRKYSAPASAAPMAATTYTASFMPRTSMPCDSAATSLSRIASSARPRLLRRNRYTSVIAAMTQTSAVQ